MKRIGSSLTPMFEQIAAGRVERHLREALTEAAEALAHCRGLQVNRFGRTHELTQAAVDALTDALNESAYWAGDENDES